MKDDRLFVATGSQTIGPYFAVGLTTNPALGTIAPPGVPGERITVVVQVFDCDGKPVQDSMIELWQADASGKYAHPADPNSGAAAFHGFGRLPTDEKGECVFDTVRPGKVPAPGGGMQAPHINVNVFSRGVLWHLNTRIYFAGDPANETDDVLKLVPQERRSTLMAQPDPKQPGRWQFTIHLCGDQETVFFEV